MKCKQEENMGNENNQHTWRSLSEEVAGRVEQASQAVVAVHGRRRISSTGVHWQEGIVVTAAHSVKQKEDIAVTLPNQQMGVATLVGVDKSLDLAILKMEDAALPLLETSDLSQTRVGHFGVAVGRGPDGSVGAILGMVGNVSEPWRRWGGSEIDQYVQIDMRLYPGYSGCPFVTDQGRGLGILTSGLSHQKTLLLPTTTIARVLGPLLEQGFVPRSFLGVGLHPVQLPETLAQELELSSTQGVVVVGLEPDGPAQQAGMLVGDILIAMAGHPVETPHAVHEALSPESVGTPMTVSLIRGGQRIEVEVTLGQRP